MKNITRICCAAWMLVAVSCSGGRVMNKLCEVESFINDRPDSALSVIQSIDTLQLRTKAEKAKYSLLHAMALDKSLAFPKDESIIMPAVEYYKKHGSHDEKLKAFFYLGAIQFNAGKTDDAAVSYSLSEREAAGASDNIAKGVLFSCFADLYNKVHNVDKEIEYVNRSVKMFKEAQDEKHLALCDGRLAMAYAAEHEWEKADSLFRCGLAKAVNDSFAMSSFMSNYAKLKMLKPDPDPRGAIELLDEKINIYKKDFVEFDYEIYAYASAMIGEIDTCNEIMDFLSSSGVEQSSYLFIK